MKVFLVRLFALVFCCFLLALQSFAATYYVSASGTGNGASSTTPMSNDVFALQLYNAAAGDVFILSAGTYKPVYDVSGKTPANKRLATFYIKSAVTIKADAGVAYLSGEIGTAALTDNCYHVVTIADNLVVPAPRYVLDNVTVTAGFANGGGIYSFGAGMYIGKSTQVGFNKLVVSKNGGVSHGVGVYAADKSNTVFDAPQFIENTSVNDVYGGGFSAWTGAVVVMNNPLFKDNKANHGGGAHFWTAKGTLNNPTFVGNIATSGHGGAIDNAIQSELTINGGSFTGNKSGTWGGAIHNEDRSILYIDGATIAKNQAVHGGAFHNTSSTATIKNTTMQGNKAIGGHGGAIDNYVSKLDLFNVNILDNFTDTWGGGIHNETSATLTFHKGSISGNRAVHGGGFHNTNSTAEFYNVVIEKDTASAHGGGVNTYGGTTLMDSCVVRNNIVTAGDGGGIHHEAGGLTLRRSEISGNKAPAGQGGGLVVIATPFRMTNNTVSGNEALSYGAGISIHVAGTMVNNTIVDNNIKGAVAAYTGGGMFAAVHPYLLNTIISGNTKGGVITAGKATGGVANNVSAANLTASRTNNNIIGNYYYPSGSATPLAGASFDKATHLAPLASNGITQAYPLTGTNNPASIMGNSSVLTDADASLKYDQWGTKRVSPPSIGSYEGGKGTQMIAATDYQTLIGMAPVTVDVLENDFLYLCTSSNIVLSISKNGTQGIAVLDGNKIKYTPNANFGGLDSITYKINCPLLGTSADVEGKLYLTMNMLPDNVTEAACAGKATATLWSMTEVPINKARKIYNYLPLLVGDIDGDGKVEIIAGTAGASTGSVSYPTKGLEVFTYNGTSVEPKSQIVFENNLEVSTFGAMAMARYAGQGYIIVCGGDMYLYAYSPSGVELWKSSNTVASSQTVPGFADFNNDGIPEVYAGNSIFSIIDGKRLCSGGANNKGALGTNVMSVAADIIGDGKLELCAGTQIYQVNISNYNGEAGNSMSVLTNYTLTNIPANAKSDGFTQVADIDLDGKLEIVVTSKNTKNVIYAWKPADNNGSTLLGSYELASTGSVSIPMIGDIDGDKYPEITFISSGNVFYAVRYNASKPLGSRLEQKWTTTHTDNSGCTGMVLFDFNLDGQQEIVYRDETNLRILDGTSQATVDNPLANIVGVLSGTLREHPIVADLDGDGAAEIVVSGGTIAGESQNGYLRVFKTAGSPWAPARKVWNQYAYNAINVNNDLTIPRVQFNPATRLPGPDGVLGNTDDVRPYNGFLMQQTTLSQNGEPLWLVPNIQWVDAPSFRYYGQGDSLVVTLRVTNLGDAATTSPLYVSVYLDETIVAKRVQVVTYNGVINPDQQATFSFRIDQASTKLDIENDNNLLIRLNDNGTIYPVQQVCEESGAVAMRPVISIVRAVNDFYGVFANTPTNLPVVNNDQLGLCPLAAPKVVANPKHGTCVVVGDSLKYTPTAGYLGLDTLRYRVVCDKDSAEAYVYLRVYSRPDNIIDPAGCVLPFQPIEFKVKQQWSTNTGNAQTGTLVGDLDGDGLPEIIAYGSDLLSIKVLNGQTGAEKATIAIPSAIGKDGFYPVMTAVLVDADKNGRRELILTRSDLKIMSYEVNTVGGVFSLEQKWSDFATYLNPPSVDNALPQPIVADFNGDGIPELVVYNRIFNAVTGAYLGQTEDINSAYVGRDPQRSNNTNRSTNFMTAADMDGDGLPEIIAGAKVYKVLVNAKKDAVNCANPYKYISMGDGFTVVADIDMDGFLDVVISNVMSGTTWLHVWSPLTNTIIDEFPIYKPTSYPGQSCPFVGDIDGVVDPTTGMKYPEICLTIGDPGSPTVGKGSVKAYKYLPSTKKLSPKWTLPTSDGSGCTGITLFDFNNDGVNELVYRDMTDLRILNGTLDDIQPTLADVSATFKCVSGTAFEYPVIADIDGDGSANICVTCVDKVNNVDVHNVRTYESATQPWAPTRKVWNQVNYEPTMINNDLTVPRYPIPKNTAINGKYPYNGALIQVPIMDELAEPVVEAADPAVVQFWAQGKDASTVRIFVSIENKGRKFTNGSLPVALYANATYTSPALAVMPVGRAIAPGAKDTIYIDVPEASIQSAVSVRIQDDGVKYPADGPYLDCDYTNNFKAIAGLLVLRADAATVLAGSTNNQIVILANDSLAGCQASNITLAVATQPKHGAVSFSALDKRLVYNPTGGYVGADSIEYQVTDCNNPQQTATAWVYITVVNIPDNFSDLKCFTDAPSTIFDIKKIESTISSLQTYAIPLVGDVDDDGEIEILIPKNYAAQNWRSKNIVVVNGKTSTVREEIVTPVCQASVLPAMYKVDGVSYIAVPTVTTAEGPVINPDKVYAYKYDKVQGKWVDAWDSDEIYNVASPLSVAVYDLDADGTPEVIVGGKIFNGKTGKTLAHLPTSTGNQSIAVANLLGDEKSEIVVNGQVYSANFANKDGFNSTALTLLRSAPTTTSIIDNSTVVADFNQDGHLDVLIVGPKAKGVTSTSIVVAIWDVYNNKYLGGTPIEIPSTASGGFTVGSSVPSVGEVNGKSGLEFIFMTNNLLYCYTYDVGTDKISNWWKFPVSDQSGSTGITLFDFNLEGKDKLVYRDEVCLRILDGSVKDKVTEIRKYSNLFSGTGSEYPVIADVDIDGSSEIITIGAKNSGDNRNGYLYILEPVSGTWAPSRKVWNQYAYNSANVNNDLTIPRTLFNTASVFPGVDGIIGTADDVRPFNGFLKQQTILNKNGLPLFPAPDYELNPKWTISRHQGDSATIHFCVENKGDANGAAPFYVALYKGITPVAANVAVVDSLAQVPAVGQTVCYNWVIHNFSSLKLPATGEITLSVNDKGKGNIVVAECVANNDSYPRKIEYMLIPTDDAVSVLKGSANNQIRVLGNDSLAGCTNANVTVSIVTQPLHGSASFSGNSLVYTPAAGYLGPDQVEYKVTDCNNPQQTATAWVYITVVDIPDNFSDADCFVDKGGSVWGIRQASSLGAGVISTYFTPLVGDLNGDGKPEIVVPSQHGSVVNDIAGMNSSHRIQRITVFDGNTKAGFEFVTKRPFTPIGAGMVAMAKVNISGKDTGIIVVAEADRYLRAYNRKGVLVWESTGTDTWTDNTNPQSATSVSFADFNGDGVVEVYAGNRIFNATTGKLLCKGSGNFGYKAYNAPSTGVLENAMTIAADVWGDSRLELIAGSQVYQVATDLSSMTVVSELQGDIASIEDPTYNKLPKDGFTQVVDIDNDGKLEVLVEARVALNVYFIYVWSPEKKQILAQKLLRGTDLGTDVTGVPFIGDIDGKADKLPEILFIGTAVYNASSTQNRFIYAYKYEKGNNLLSEFWKLAHEDNSGFTGLTLFDFNQDGISEIVYRDEKKLRIINGSMKPAVDLATFDCTSGTGYEYPTIADIDGDGAAEILITSTVSGYNGDLRIFKSKAGTTWAPARKVWNQYVYNAVNVNNDLSIPRYQLNPATAFPGVDGILGTADDVRPYNAFLQQQTTLNKNGSTLFLAPNAQWVTDPVMSYHANGDSITVTVTLRNDGDAALVAPVCVSVYMDQVTGNRIATGCSNKTIMQGESLQFSFSIPNASAYFKSGMSSFMFRLNDNGERYPAQPVCNYDGNIRGLPVDKMPFAQQDKITILACETLEFNYQGNDYIPAGTTVSITKNPTLGVFQDLGATARYADQAPCHPFQTDTIRYLLTNGSFTAEGQILVSILPRPTIILLDSCSFQPKLTLDYQYPGSTYQWMYSSDNGTSWTNVSSPTAQSPTLFVNTVAKYRVAITLASGRTITIDPVDLEIVATSILQSDLVWYQTSLNR